MSYDSCKMVVCAVQKCMVPINKLKVPLISPDWWTDDGWDAPTGHKRQALPGITCIEPLGNGPTSIRGPAPANPTWPCALGRVIGLPRLQKNLAESLPGAELIDG